MLKDLSGHSEEPDFASDCCANERREAGRQSAEPSRARFRASLWLGIAADISRERASEEMKGHVPC